MSTETEIRVMSEDVTIYNAEGQVVKTKSTTPDLDPDFLKSFYQLVRGGSFVDEITRQPYAKHPFVYACVSAIAQPISQLPAVLFKKDDPETLIYEHAVLDLLHRPNPMMTGNEFWEALLLNLLLPTTTTPGGQCFILPADETGNPVDLVKGDIPVELYPFNDNFVKPRTVDHKFTGWAYKHPSGREIFYYPDQIIRIRLFNPYNWLLGLSPLSSLYASVVNDAKASELSDKFLDNNAMLGTILTTDEKLTRDQVDMLKGLFREQYEGWSKAGKTALLHSGMKLQQVTRALSDLQLVEQRNMNREDIMAVYGVGKTILGLTDTVNRATAAVEKELFWEDTLVPLILKIWNGLNPQWVRFVDNRDLRGKFDLSEVQALKKDVEGKINNALKLIMTGVPANEAFRIVSLDTGTDKMQWLDEPWVKGPRVNLNTGELIGSPVQVAASMESIVKDTGLKEIRTADGEGLSVKEQYWLDYVTKTLDEPERKFKRVFIAYLTQQRNAFLDKIDDWAKRRKGLRTKVEARVSDFMIDKEPQDKKLIKAADPVFDDTIKLQTARLTEELGELTVWDPTSPLIDEIKKKRTKFLKGINTETFRTMRKEVERVIKENTGETVQTIAKELKKAERAVYDRKIASSAKTVARTETSTIASTTRFQIMKAEGVEKHEWVTANDENVRDSHVAEGMSEAVKIGDPFPVTGLQYPLESGGAPEEVINCRCTTMIVT